MHGHIIRWREAGKSVKATAFTWDLFAQAGDTLTAESEVLEKRESASRPGAGIVTVKTTGFNQHGKIVCHFTRTMLIARQGHSVEDKVGY